ncbi:MAG TPA: hypothetical protein VJI15_01005 [Candidatus Nanoarchaeia archaeon]|nr:hypothetical protein [Candidatus Nanoarchaeia archaeon]
MMAFDLSTSRDTFIGAILFLSSVLVVLFFATRDRKRTGITIAAILLMWFMLVVGLAQFNFFSLELLLAPNIFLGFIILFILLQKAYASTTIKNVGKRISLPWLIAIQTYRVVGIVFLSMYSQGFLPGFFAFPAGFGDLLVGITAPFVAFFLWKKTSWSRKLARWWNYLGILDLVVAIGVGIFGYPLFQLFLEKPFQIVAMNPSTGIMASYPMVLIPLFIVPLGMILHLMGLRELKRNI